MFYTLRLLESGSKKNVPVLDEFVGDKITKKELFKDIAKESFNAVMPVLQLKDQAQFKCVVKLAIACKYTDPSTVETFSDLLNSSKDSFNKKLQNKLIRAAKSIGTHVPKMMSTCIEDSAVFFPKLKVISSGITSSTLDSGRWVTGSKDGTLVGAFCLLSSTHQIGDGPALSLFERMAMEEPCVIALLRELSDDKAFIQELIDTAAQHRVESPSTTVSQFHKQNFINYQGRRITVTPLQSVNTTVALARSINSTFQNNARVNIKRYAAGGGQSQNVSSLNQDLGGSIPHFYAWIPSNKKRQDVFYYLYRTKRLSLTKPQKSLVATMAKTISSIEHRGQSNHFYRKAIVQQFTQQAQLLLDVLESFAVEFNKVRDENIRQKVRDKMNGQVMAYFVANSYQQKKETSVAIAIELLALVSAEMKRNKLNVHIEGDAIEATVLVLEKERYYALCFNSWFVWLWFI